jgi:hypothetical protein
MFLMPDRGSTSWSEAVKNINDLKDFFVDAEWIASLPGVNKMIKDALKSKEER